MRVGVIRGDIPGPIFVNDLEDVSQWCPSIEPRGQDRYLSRPDLTLVGAALAANIPASRKGTLDISAGVTVVLGASDVLQIRVSPTAGYTSCTVAAAVYTAAAFIVAVNAAISASAMRGLVVASLDETGLYFVLRTTAKGTGSYLGVNVLATSTLNTLVGFANPAFAFTVPTAAAVITATLPVLGVLDLRDVITLQPLLGYGTTLAERTAVADTIAPRFIETEVVKKSFQVGNLADLRNALFNPDPNRLPAIANGPAITVTQDDGFTLYTAPLTALTNAQINVPIANWLTLTGTDLGITERPADTEVHLIDESNLPTQALPVILPGRLIVASGGSISQTSITIPPALKPAWIVATTSKARVMFTSFASNKRAF